LSVVVIGDPGAFFARVFEGRYSIQTNRRSMSKKPLAKDPLSKNHVVVSQETSSTQGRI
jgi:hypothetical protein